METTELMLTTLPPAGAELLDRFLSGQDEPQHVQIELLVEVLRGDGLDRRELVDAGVVHQDVELAEGLSSSPRTAARTSASFATSACTATAFPPSPSDLGDDLLGPGLARSVVDDDRRALGGELPGDLGPDPLRCTGDDRDFPGEFLRGGHGNRPFPPRMAACCLRISCTLQLGEDTEGAVASCNHFGFLGYAIPPARITP